MLAVRQAGRRAPVKNVLAASVRCYGDSVDLTSKLQNLDNTEDVLKFYHAHAG